MKRFILALAVLVMIGVMPVQALATSHYSYENSEKERLSQKIHCARTYAEHLKNAQKHPKSQQKPNGMLTAEEQARWWMRLPRPHQWSSLRRRPEKDTDVSYEVCVRN